MLALGSLNQLKYSMTLSAIMPEVLYISRSLSKNIKNEN